MKNVRIMAGPISEMNNGREELSAEGTLPTFSGARLKTSCTAISMLMKFSLRMHLFYLKLVATEF